MARVLPADLRRHIFVFIPFRQLQKWIDTGANDRFFDAQFFKYLLTHRYKLTAEQIASAYDNQTTLSRYEAYTDAVTNLDELGYEQHLYVDAAYALLRAIKNNDQELFLYYLLRCAQPGDRSVTDNTYMDLMLYYAMLNKNIEMIILLLAYFNTHDFRLLNTGYHSDPFWAGKKIETNSHRIEIPIPRSRNYTLISKTVNALVELDANSLKTLINQNPNMTNISSKSLYSVSGIDDIITKTMIDNARIIKSLITQFEPTIEIKIYELFIDILLNNDIVITPEIKQELDETGFGDRALRLALSVCNYNAFNLFRQFLRSDMRISISEVLYSPKEVWNELKLMELKSEYVNNILISAFLCGKSAELHDYMLQLLYYSLFDPKPVVNTAEHLIHVYNHNPDYNITIKPLNQDVVDVIKILLDDYPMPNTWKLLEPMDKRPISEIRKTADGIKYLSQL